jgi:hypothetical protein
MQTHELKTLAHAFEETWKKRKTFEIRKNDRDFQVGDVVKLREVVYHPAREGDDVLVYTGRSIIGVISYLTTFEQQPGYVVFSLTHLTFHGSF